jgi:tRNA threonylcarbamoyladenosine biosynthesis protein TsaE
MTEQLNCGSLDELEGIAIRLIEKYPDKRIFAFYGAMGAGKTTFIKVLCKHLQVLDVVNSPTFAIVNEYICRDDSRVYHFDLYRLKSWKEMLDIGYEDYFFSGHYCLIEWPEKISDLLPEDTIEVHIDADILGKNRVFTF